MHGKLAITTGWPLAKTATLRDAARNKGRARLLRRSHGDRGLYCCTI